jgi:DNA-binding transcriptional ArsR family regulator
VDYHPGMDIFDVLAEPGRRVLLNMLLDGEVAAGDLAAALPKLSQPAVSRHLHVLRQAGLVEVRADKQKRMYRLKPLCLVEVDTFLQPYRQRWAKQAASRGRQIKGPESGTRTGRKKRGPGR